MSISLVDFSVIRPKKIMPQAETLQWLAKAHTKAESFKQKWPSDSEESSAFHSAIKERLFKLGVGINKVEQRATQVLSYLNSDDVWELAEGINLKKRSQHYDKEASDALDDFYPINTKPPCHLIHVSCTGYVAPSAAQKLVSKRDFGAFTQVTHAYHMGCYASIPAIRMAKGFLAEPSCSQVDIVHTELCSLQINPLLHETEQLIVQTLFADGFIKYSATRSLSKGKNSLHLLSLHEEIIPDSTLSMSWTSEEWGMKMTLAKEVPLLIARRLEAFLHTLIQKANLDPKSLLSKALFAIHPGGPKVIDNIAYLLHLSEEQIFHSRTVLYNFGNMSSATLPHIWEKIVNDSTVPKKTLILSLAFGPGLTICGALYEKGES